MTAASGDELPLLRALAALVGVLALAAAALWLLRRYAMDPLAGRAGAARLAVVASQSVDARVRLVLVRRDGVEHLLVLAPSGITLIESQAVPVEPPAPASPSC